MLIEKPMYAYEISKALVERFEISAATVTVYVVLHRMEGEGLIRTGERMAVFGRPDRIYFEITEKGLETLKKGQEFIKASLERLK
jgi:DNA-binding PadR family transcriptional regulator